MSEQIRIKEGLLDRLRKFSGLTSDDAMARLLNVSRATIDRIKSGDQPSAKFMAALCTTFGLGLGEAFEIYEVSEEVQAA
ncbi:helix-turn-helix domain-containing protein [Glutamicibacter sp. AOP12-B1-11]|uniref:helix-turn-helix domain-containing protein n=1 Tax=Glutamicibacter sp. AOP12-B1-11 TaxID=3457725 RepID=UPI00403415E1